MLDLSHQAGVPVCVTDKAELGYHAAYNAYRGFYINKEKFSPFIREWAEENDAWGADITTMDVKTAQSFYGKCGG